MTKKEFEDIYNKQYDYLFYYTLKRIVVYEDVEDILSDTFLALYNTHSNLDKKEGIKYIWGILKNKINTFLAKKYSIQLKSFDEEYEQIENGRIIDNKTKYKTLVYTYLDKLTKQERNVFKYKYELDYKSVEIAKELNITKNHVKVINNRLIN